MASQDAQTFRGHYPQLDDQNFQIHGHCLLLVIILFSLLLFFTLLCLYAKWVCRYRLPSAWDDHPAAALGQPSHSAGLDPATIDGFAVKLHCSSLAEEAQCSICLSGFVEGEKVKVMPECRHAFHPECVDKWLSSHSSCPLCRAALGVERKLIGEDESD